MKFKIYHTWYIENAEDIEINTIEELIQLVEKYRCGIIVERSDYFVGDDEWEHEYELEIYDTWRE